MKKIYIVTIVVGTLFIVGFAFSGSITLIDNRTFASEERVKYAANQATHLRVSMPGGAPITLRTNGQGKSQLTLGDGREMATTYTGAETKTELENRSARPLSRWTKYPGGVFDNRPTTMQPGIEPHCNPGFHIRSADNVSLNNCKVKWGDDKPNEFTHALETEDVTGLKLTRFTGESAHPERDKAISKH